MHQADGQAAVDDAGRPIERGCPFERALIAVVAVLRWRRDHQPSGCGGCEIGVTHCRWPGQRDVVLRVLPIHWRVLRHIPEVEPDRDGLPDAKERAVVPVHHDAVKRGHIRRADREIRGHGSPQRKGLIVVLPGNG